jgi:hypothetical protein
MNKNRIRGLLCGARRHRTKKPISTKSTGGKSGGCARKAVEFTSGDPPHVTGIVTEDGAIHLERAAGVSSGHSRLERPKAQTVRSGE